MSESYFEEARANLDQGLDPVHSNPHPFGSVKWHDYNNACFSVLKREINDMRNMQVVKQEPTVETYIILREDWVVGTFTDKEEFEKEFKETCDKARLSAVTVYHAGKAMHVKAVYE